MTTEIVVERDVERVFHLQCSCGSALVSTEKKITCNTCGKSLQVRRVRKRGASPVAVEYHFDCCFCGVALVSRKKLATCTHCGETLQILRAEKLTSRTSPSLLRLALIKDFERLCISLGVAILILCFFYGLILD
jgi:hypothetical protein